MEQDLDIVNKVAQSNLISIALEDWYAENPRYIIDLKDYLFQGLIIRESDIRQAIKNTDWSIYSDGYVALCCTEDVILPTWAYMLFSIALAPFAKIIIVGDKDALEDAIWKQVIDQKVEETQYETDAKVVIKGCTKKPVTLFAYSYLAQKLSSLCQSIMYGEPCSTVPLFKRKKG